MKTGHWNFYGGASCLLTLRVEGINRRGPEYVHEGESPPPFPLRLDVYSAYTPKSLVQ